MRKKATYKDWNLILKKVGENYDKYPPLILKKILNLDSSTTGRLYSKFPKLRELSKNFESKLDDKKAFKYMQYLITDFCGFKLDDKLPTLIRKKIFKGQYYSLYNYALNRSQKLEAWQNTSAIGFLVCNAFPKKFLKSQFPKYKKTEIFKTKKDIFLTMIEMFKLENQIDLNKTDLDKDILISMILDRHGTFKDPLLKKYGISRIYWSKIFKTKYLKNLRFELLNFLGLEEKAKRETLKKLREKIKVDKCEICRESRAIQIHHIINVQDSNILKPKDNINDKNNLIALCVYHHMDAGKIKLNSYYKKNGFKGIKKRIIADLKII